MEERNPLAIDGREKSWMSYDTDSTSSSKTSNKASAKKDSSQRRICHEVVHQPEKYDILCGKDKTFNNHTGNQVFRAVIMMWVDTYKAATSKQEKMRITRNIVTYMHKQYNSRFLKRVGVERDQCSWEQIGEDAARDKISHALRFAATSIGCGKPSILSKATPVFAKTENSRPRTTSMSDHDGSQTNQDSANETFSSFYPLDKQFQQGPGPITEPRASEFPTSATAPNFDCNPVSLSAQSTNFHSAFPHDVHAQFTTRRSTFDFSKQNHYSSSFPALSGISEHVLSNMMVAQCHQSHAMNRIIESNNLAPIHYQTHPWFSNDQKDPCLSHFQVMANVLADTSGTRFPDATAGMPFASLCRSRESTITCDDSKRRASELSIIAKEDLDALFDDIASEDEYDE